MIWREKTRKVYQPKKGNITEKGEVLAGLHRESRCALDWRRVYVVVCSAVRCALPLLLGMEYPRKPLIVDSKS